MMDVEGNRSEKEKGKKRERKAGRVRLRLSGRWEKVENLQEKHSVPDS
jgi:hypothetical protein